MALRTLTRSGINRSRGGNPEDRGRSYLFESGESNRARRNIRIPAVSLPKALVALAMVLEVPGYASLCDPEHLVIKVETSEAESVEPPKNEQQGLF
jgi:hypothetical protein